ncbi:unnamed protein product [Pedinophyceae sp. YPF-701]|nr:unnamed protein product [Pedinophyceae sp. YPF-701]
MQTRLSSSFAAVRPAGHDAAASARLARWPSTGRQALRPAARAAAVVRPELDAARRSIRVFASDSRDVSAQSASADPKPSTRPDLPKNFEPSREQDLYRWWEESGMFRPEQAPAAPDAAPFVVSMPPPNVTGKLHMGHAMFVTLEDVLVRFNRMRGKRALWVPGTDHAGIATQMVVEKLLAQEGTSRREVGRAAFTERVWDWRGEYGGFITQQLRRLGASCDWSRERFTLDDGLSAAVAEAFVRLHDKGLVYRGSYMVNWSPSLQTAVSDIEVEFSEEAGKLYFFKYPVEGGEDGEEEFLPVATTRPETILGDTAVAVNPNDERYKHLVGRRCVVPMTDRTVPIIADEYVDMEFGTGALKITPGHDPNDYEIGQRFDLEIISIMNKDASMNENAGSYAGLDRFECRKALWADMESTGLAIRVEDYEMRVPRSQRGGEVIEPMVSEQWFVKMEPLAKPALAAVRSGDIRIVPDRFEKTYTGWLDGIKDWCVSRQLWWGHRIPVWYVHADEDAAAAARAGPAEGRSGEYVVARDEEEAYDKARAAHGDGVALVQEPDVLDTWFSSALWPFSTLGWPAKTEDLERYYPTQVMETGHDILFFWVARMIMMGIELTGQSPFHTVFLHGLVRDEKGRKMSKSLGNVVDPVDTIETYGTDSLRFTLATGTTPGQDINLSMDRVTANRNFTNKIWNAGKFILFNLSQEDKVSDADYEALRGATVTDPAEIAALPLTERWIVSATHRCVDRVTALLEKLDMGEAGRQLYDFFWGEFADWYIEGSKTRLYSDDHATAQETRKVLVYVYDTLLRLLHPMMPFCTEDLWQAIPHRGEALIAAEWPEPGRYVDEGAIASFEALQATVRAIRNCRAEYGVEISKKIAATLVVEDEALRAEMASEVRAIAALAKLEEASVEVVGAAGEAAVGNGGESVTLVVRDGVEVLVPLAGLFDAKKEMARLEKQKSKIEKELGSLKGRLGNKGFVEKAPESVVNEVKAQAAELEEQLAAVQEKMDKVAAMAG